MSTKRLFKNLIDLGASDSDDVSDEVRSYAGILSEYLIEKEGLNLYSKKQIYEMIKQRYQKDEFDTCFDGPRKLIFQNFVFVLFNNELTVVLITPINRYKVVTGDPNFNVKTTQKVWSNVDFPEGANDNDYTKKYKKIISKLEEIGIKCKYSRLSGHCLSDKNYISLNINRWLTQDIASVVEGIKDLKKELEKNMSYEEYKGWVE